MNHTETFLASTTASAAIFCAALLAVGSGETNNAPGVRLLAQPHGIVTLDGCQLGGCIEGRSNGVFAVFTLANPAPAEKEIQFHYLASYTPAASPMSRMGPFPRAVSNGTLSVRIPTGNLTREVLLRPALPADLAQGVRTNRLAAPAGGSTNTAALLEGWSPETWTLTVARQPIKAVMRAGGAVAPAPSSGAASLDKGEAVLASTRLERTGPQP